MKSAGTLFCLLLVTVMFNRGYCQSTGDTLYSQNGAWYCHERKIDDLYDFNIYLNRTDSSRVYFKNAKKFHAISRPLFFLGSSIVLGTVAYTFSEVSKQMDFPYGYPILFGGALMVISIPITVVKSYNLRKAVCYYNAFCRSTGKLIN